MRLAADPGRFLSSVQIGITFLGNPLVLIGHRRKPDQRRPGTPRGRGRNR
jgi:hypothetical protein